MILVVAAALTDAAERVLVQQRPGGASHAGLWEFPGGKIENTESPQSALIRELREELGVAVDPDDLEPFAFSVAPRGEPQILLLLFLCRRWSNRPEAIHATAIKWVATQDLPALAMPPADIPLAIRLCQVGARPVT